MFMDGPSSLKWVRDRIISGEAGTLAVAFWGDGAIQQLGFKERTSGKLLRVICNLKMGGTNPAVIKQLRRFPNVEVTHSEILHGKVYAFEQQILIGSSNASANGLGFEGRELGGWHEANVLTRREDVREDLTGWLSKLREKDISKDDLDAAEKIWKKRRRSRYALTFGKLIDQVLAGPQSFYDRDVYMIVWNVDEEDENVLDAADEAKREFGENTDWYFDWPELPETGEFVSFRSGTKGRLSEEALLVRNVHCSNCRVDGRDEKLELFSKIGGARCSAHEKRQWAEIVEWFKRTTRDLPGKEGWSSESKAGFVHLKHVAEAIKFGEIRLDGLVSK